MSKICQWTKVTRKQLSFGIPMVWWVQKNHVASGYSKKTGQKLSYSNLDSAIHPVPHSQEIPVTVFTELSSLEDENDICESDENHGHASDTDFVNISTKERENSNQAELNDLIRDLGLPKELSELLASRLKEKNMLQKETNVTFYRNRGKGLLAFFETGNDFVYCCDVAGLLVAMGVPQYDTNEWRLFIDSLKYVLLHSGNLFGAIPIGHSVYLKEKHEHIKVLDLLKYDDHKWVICVDLKMVNFLHGQQRGYKKYPCFLCLWDSQAKDKHWQQKAWPVRKSLTVVEKNIIHQPLVELEKIIFPRVHLKLGLMKQFVKTLNVKGDCFQFVCTIFPGLSHDKIKAGIFDGTQIKKLIKCKNFSSSMTEVEKRAWNAFMAVVKEFLGNTKAANYKDLVETLLDSFHALGCNMSIKVHFFKNHSMNFLLILET